MQTFIKQKFTCVGMFVCVGGAVTFECAQKCVKDLQDAMVVQDYQNFALSGHSCTVDLLHPFKCDIATVLMGEGLTMF